MAGLDETGFDVVVVGGGSAGAVVAARLSEDASVRVCLLEAGGEPPEHSAMPAAVSTLLNDPDYDWCFTGDPGGVGKGLVTGEMLVPRGKMLGGSSALNYMAYVRGHPGDFDAWAQHAGDEGWSYDAVLPYFKKAEGLSPSGDVVIDPDAHSTDGPLGVSVRSPVMTGAQQFVEACVGAGIPRGDYNGTDRGGPDGCASLFQTTTKDGKRASTHVAYLAPAADRDNLTVVTHAHATRVVLDSNGDTPRATGVEYRDADGEAHVVDAREVVVSTGAVCSPQLLMLSGIGPADHLAEHGIDVVVDNAHVGQHLKDHLLLALFYPAEGIGTPMAEIAVGLGPDALREPAGPLPADPADDDAMPEELKAVKAEAERQLVEWATSGHGVASSSLYDATAFFSTGLGDEHTHDAQVGFLTCGYTPEIWTDVFNYDVTQIFEEPHTALDVERGVVAVLANPVQPHSEGAVRLRSADPTAKPVIDLNYLAEQHDVDVMVEVVRRSMAIADAWPEPGLGDLMVPKVISERHGITSADELTDDAIEDWARHFASTVYHETSTCRMGDVVDAELRVMGVDGLRVADASVMPDVVSGNTNAAAIMIGEKAAEMVAADLGASLHDVVGAA